MWPLSPANTLLLDDIRQPDWCHHGTLRRTDNYFPMVLYDESLTAVVQFNALKLQRNAFFPHIECEFCKMTNEANCV